MLSEQARPAEAFRSILLTTADRTGSMAGKPSASLYFSDGFDHRVAIAERLLADFEAETGRLGRSDKAIDGHRDILQKARIQIVVEMIDTLDDVEVCKGRRGVERSVPQYGSAAGVRCGGDLVGIGHVGDLPGFGNSSTPRDVVHYYIDCFSLKHLAETEACRQPLADADRDRGFALERTV